MCKTSTHQFSLVVALMILLILAASFSAFALAFFAFIYENDFGAVCLLVVAFLGVATSTYLFFRTRGRVMRLKTELPPVVTIVECKKCGLKSIRMFQHGDYVFKKAEPCQKCNEKMLITAIYREAREKT